MQLSQDIPQWLAAHHSDGVNLQIKELLYYRTKASLLNLALGRPAQAKLAGGYLAKTKGRGMEFDEARHYQPGDDIRAIDWRVTARTGKTHTKIYREEKERPVFVLADLSSSMHFGTQLLFKSVQVAHLTALIAWAAHKRGDRIGGLVFNQTQHKEFKPFSRQKAVLSLLNGMVKLHKPHEIQDKNSVSNVTFADACARLRRLAHPGSLVFVLSDFAQLNDTAQQHLAQLSRHCEVTAYPISDPFEHTLPQSKYQQMLNLTDGYNEQQILIGEQGIATQYQTEHEQRFNSIHSRLKKSRANVVPISCGLSLERQLAKRSSETDV
ncbi:DUF58 domain-containing protein [Paraglaciecola chathamensis]|uniref:DUF58 domain-containing protein n=1 Tax=Paraglaciecola chathamensis S18K6 TaxID=1127672 RepID=A0AAV3USI0_9ALTE|nr:DUF58 domain-containing protein [Paraglaciecola chathamensis]GAC08066.1 hypothetical protein GCHA_0100 [Paraglaciecola chathamensis S18K6]